MQSKGYLCTVHVHVPCARYYSAHHPTPPRPCQPRCSWAGAHLCCNADFPLSVALHLGNDHLGGVVVCGRQRLPGGRQPLAPAAPLRVEFDSHHLRVARPGGACLSARIA